LKKKQPEFPYEVDEQIALFEWAGLMESRIPELKLLNGSLNGVRITIGQAMKMRRAGMKKGYPDIFLPVRKGRYSGLYIELKRIKGGSVKPEQKEWLSDLSMQGFKTCVCKGFDEARGEIERYFLEGKA